jgi:murein DD-endopeptidase MepM/ murein hydrolase activator NlpD
MKTPLNRAKRPFLFSCSASLLGGLGLLSTSFIAPQVAMTTNTLAIPDAPAGEATNRETLPVAPAKFAQPTSPEVAPKLFVPGAPVKSQPEKIAPKPTVSNFYPANSPKTPLSAPKVFVPSLKKPLPLTQPAAPAELQGKNSFIDTGSYGQAKGTNYTPPSAVVLTERGTGCNAVSQNGRLLVGSCGPVALKRPEVSPQTRRFVPSSPQRLASNEGVSTRLQPVRRRIEAQNFYPRPVATVATTRLQGLSLALEPITQGQPSVARYSVAPPDQRRTSLIFPLPVAAAITSSFGWRLHPIAGTARMHSGTDIGAPVGTPVLAAYPGEVATADWEGGYGLMVTLRHEDGTQESRYAHLSEIYVQPGQWVEQGTVIGRVGSTGYSTGPHLHFEWRHLTDEGWVAVDAGLHLEYALENLARSLQLAQTPVKPQG